MLTLSYRRGFTLLESLAVLTVVTSLLVLGAHYAQQRLDAAINERAASQLRTVTEAAKRHVQAYWFAKPLTSFDTFSPLTTAKIKKHDLQSELLQLSNKSNVYQQQYAIFVKPEQPDANNLPKQVQLLVLTTDGQVIKERSLRQIARQLGGPGGYISTQDATTILGSQGGWTLPLSAASPLPATTPGHLASLSYLYAADVTNTQGLLHRGSNGDSTLNQMETNLLMQGNAITFKAKGTNGGEATISAEQMSLKQGSQSVSLSCNQQTAEIVVKGDAGSVSLYPEKVTVQVELEPSQWKKKEVEAYSGSELHARWNKVPYYELTAGGDGHFQAFAKRLCAQESNENDKLKAVGRLFMLGSPNQAETQLYICISATVAQAVQRFNQKSIAPAGSSKP